MKKAWHQQTKIKKVEFDGHKFDSETEKEFYIFLKSGKYRPGIKNIILQPKFILIPAYVKNGKKIQAITYAADFQIEFESGETEIIDVKGFVTNEFKRTKKLFEYFYPHNLIVISKFPNKYGGQFGLLSELESLRKKEKANGKKAKKDG